MVAADRVSISAAIGLVISLHQAPVFAAAQTVVPDKGFVLAPIPTTADPPGTVFRIAPSGVRFDVADLSSRLPHHLADVALADFTSSRTVNAGSLLRFLTRAKVDAGVWAARTITFRVRGTKKESTQDAEIDAVVRQAFPVGTLKRPGEYFIIRETISATSVDYDLSNEMLAALGGEAQLTAALKGNANLKVTASGGRQLHQNFTKPHRIFYKLEELIRPVALSDTGVIRRALVSSDISWSLERSEEAPALALASAYGGLNRVQFLALQQELRDQGCGLTNVDGRYGTPTRRAIATCAKRFNTANNAAALLAAMNIGFGPNDNPPPK